jgi:hypothetical protein
MFDFHVNFGTGGATDLSISFVFSLITFSFRKTKTQNNCDIVRVKDSSVSMIILTRFPPLSKLERIDDNKV